MVEQKQRRVPAIDELQFFDPAAYKALIAQEVPDTVVRYLGTVEFNSPGATKWQEVCTKRGLAEKARKARVVWWQAASQLLLVPADVSDPQGLTISWSTTRQSGRMRLRTVFLNYGIEMLKHSAWQLPTSVQQMPKLGWCLALELDEALMVVELQKKVAASLMESAASK
jgi:hypothetical protein